ncbi:hypothetical protein ACFVXA_27810 [Streptomyces sp. NPDC058246]|uniref:hypothetical protein n=1 Tax=unclassified Streptomyces TaxID=2593676 RepID=UPI0033FB38AC
MDQGLAGLIAGVAGLIGGCVGGLATAYGARIGAHKMLEAAHAQVEAQSSAEHGHWVREQRRQTRSDIMDAYGVFMHSLNRVTDKVFDCVAPTGSDLEAVKSDARNLFLAAERLRLWGPNELVVLVQSIRGEVEDVLSLALDSPHVIASADPSAASHHYDACAAKADSAKQARTAFATAARRILGSPH